MACAVRRFDDRQLHGLVGKLRRLYVDGDLTHAQDHLYDRCLAELDRRNKQRRPGHRCVCDMCWSPFPEADEVRR